jgi:rhodanese-related sulfurtransferase
VAVPRVSREEVLQRLAGDAPPVLVDARLKYPYEHSTVKLPGALRVLGDAPLPSIPQGADVVVYDSDPNELASSRVAARFIRQGIRAAALTGGIAGWLAGGGPVETKGAPKQAAPEPGALKS